MSFNTFRRSTQVLPSHSHQKLRHDVAHGQLAEGQCYSADVIYGCWLLYRVCCLPLVTRWDELVRPGLAIEEPGR